MKNFLIGLTVGVLFVPLSSGAFSKLLSDVETGSWYESSVTRLQDLGIFTGYDDGTFKPKKAVTRAELAVVIDRAIKSTCMSDDQNTPFNCDDVVSEPSSAAKRDAQRRSDVNTILNAIYQQAIDNQGILPNEITSEATEICANSQSLCSGKVRLNELVGTYVVSIPIDPILSAGSDESGYTVKVGTEDQMVTVSSLHAETDNISVTR